MKVSHWLAKTALSDYQTFAKLLRKSIGVEFFCKTMVFVSMLTMISRRRFWASDATSEMFFYWPSTKLCRTLSYVGIV